MIDPVRCSQRHGESQDESLNEASFTNDIGLSGLRNPFRNPLWKFGQEDIYTAVCFLAHSDFIGLANFYRLLGIELRRPELQPALLLS